MCVCMPIDVYKYVRVSVGPMSLSSVQAYSPTVSLLRACIRACSRVLRPINVNLHVMCICVDVWMCMRVCMCMCV